MVGLFEKGPIGVPTFIAGPEDVKKIFGGEVGPLLGRKALGKLFSNGGTRGYITRTSHYADISDPNSLTALIAKVTLDDRLDNDGKKSEGSIKVGANVFTNWLQAQGYAEVIDNAFDASDAIVINGVSFEQGVDFVVGATAADTAQNIADAINNSVNPAIDGVVTAAIDISVVTRINITAVAFGLVGNALTLAEVDGATDNFTLSGATLGGGIDGDSITVDADQYNFGEDIIVGGSLAATAAAIQAAVDGGANVTAQVDTQDDTT